MKLFHFKQQGLTLIELMVTVAVVAILAGIAVPSYERYTTGANRTVAKTTLLQVQNRLNNFQLNNKQYTTNLTSLGYSANPLTINKSGEYTGGGDSVYSISISNPGGCGLASCFVVQAVPTGGQLTNDTDCGTLSLTLQGAKSASGSKGISCWN